MKRFCVNLFSTAALFALIQLPAQAGVIIDFDEVGPDVKGTVTGSIDTAGLAAPDENDFDFGFVWGNSFFGVGATAIGDWPGAASSGSFYGAANYSSAPSQSFAVDLGDRIDADQDTGIGFAINGLGFTLPGGYASGDSLASTSTWTGKTFTDVGLNVGTYNWTLTNGETITLNVNAVPEPTSLALLGVGAVGVMLRRRRRGLAG